MLDLRTLEQVDNYKCLGICIHKDVKEEVEINSAIEIAKKLYHAINRRFIRK